MSLSWQALAIDGTRRHTKPRYTDEQLYAMIQYVYSLQPPPNPNKMDDLAMHGQAIFEREWCSRCHSGDTYGGSKLTPVGGFKTPDNHCAADDIYEKLVGTDPNLALSTRKGTGLYRVPLLRGVWYRGSLEHNGSIATLKDWFDPRRVESDYVPTGWKGPPRTKTRGFRVTHSGSIFLTRSTRRWSPSCEPCERLATAPGTAPDRHRDLARDEGCQRPQGGKPMSFSNFINIGSDRKLSSVGSTLSHITRGSRSSQAVCSHLNASFFSPRAA